MEIYDQLGINYSALRKPDRHIEEVIWKELGDAKTILDIGAGAGSYKPHDREVTALEPSLTMINQRPQGSPTAVRASAEDIPFRDKEFDLSMATLTIHHWKNLGKGLFKMHRVSRRQLIFTWDPSHPGFWLTQDYFPEILSIDQAIFPSFEEIEKILGPMKRLTIPISHDCTDGFGCVYWRRPQAYLLPEVRQAISTCSKIKYTERGVTKLQADLK